MKCKGYYRPATLAEALELMARVPAPLPVAGATDVLVDARKEDFSGRTVVDLYAVDELRGVTQEDGLLRVGALTTHTAAWEDPLLRARAQLLSLACRTVGSLQIRNRATVGGNVANASPAADSLPALAALRAQVETAGPGGKRLLSLEEAVAGPNRSGLLERELITAILIPALEPGSRCVFRKLGRRRALAISRMTVAGILRTDGDGKVEELRLAVGAVFPRPVTFPDVDGMLDGKIPTREELEAVGAALSGKIPLITGVRASTKYKQPVCRNLTVRVLEELLKGGEELG